MRAGRFWSGTDNVGGFISQVGNTAEATQPQLHPGVGAGRRLPPPQHSGDLGWRVFSASMGRARAYASVSIPFRAGLSSNLASKVMHDSALSSLLWYCRDLEGQ